MAMKKAKASQEKRAKGAEKKAAGSKYKARDSRERAAKQNAEVGSGPKVTNKNQLKGKMKKRKAGQPK